MEISSQSFLAEFADLLGENSVTLETSLLDLDSWDSLNIVTFMALVDRQFQVVLSPQAIGECQTVGDLYSLLEGQVRQAA